MRKPPSRRSQKLRHSRELALQGLYQWQYTGSGAVEVLKNLEELEGFTSADGEFLAAELKGAISHAEELRTHLEPLADRKWDDISPIERGILLMAAWELLHQPEIPYKVTINEAIELGKRFGATDGHKWINGVLDKLASAVRPDEVAEKRRQQNER